MQITTYRKKAILTALLLAVTCFTAYSQVKKEQENRTSRFVLGGNVGLQFGTYTLIDVAPWVGYQLSPSILAGIGGTYKYYRYKILDTKISSQYYGGRIFSRYFLHKWNVSLLQDIFIHGEYEILNFHYKNGNTSDLNNQKVESLFGGAGYAAPIAPRATANLLFLWNFMDDANSPYDNPIIRVGVSFGL